MAIESRPQAPEWSDCAQSGGKGRTWNREEHKNDEARIHISGLVCSRRGSPFQPNSFLVVLFLFLLLVSPTEAADPGSTNGLTLRHHGPKAEVMFHVVNSVLTLTYSTFENDKVLEPVMARITLAITFICSVAAITLHAKHCCHTTLQRIIFCLLTATALWPCQAAVKKLFASPNEAGGLYVIPSIGLSAFIVSGITPWHRSFAPDPDGSEMVDLEIGHISETGPSETVQDERPAIQGP